VVPRFVAAALLWVPDGQQSAGTRTSITGFWMDEAFTKRSAQFD
jgi:hypothetical protein